MYECISGALSAQKVCESAGFTDVVLCTPEIGHSESDGHQQAADAIEANSSLTAGDVKHSIEAFVEQLRLSLTQGDKVKIDGLGTFHITLSSEGAEKEKDCTVRNIRRVNVRFVADKALQLVNTSHATTRGENNVDFILAGKGDGEDADGGNSGSGGSGEAPDPAA